MLEEKRIALTRRANKLISWLERPDYATYAGHDSSIHLAKLIDLTVWALERSIPAGEWEQFRQDFLGTRYILLDIFESEEAEGANYFSCLREFEGTLREYLLYIQERLISAAPI